MSYPPGTPDPNDPEGGQGAGDPWAAPPGEGSQHGPGGPEQPQYPPQPPEYPPYQPEYPQYAQPGYGQYGQPPEYPQYGQPGYGQPGYGQYQPGNASPSRNNGKATAALWTGVGSLVLTPCCGAGILGILPIVLGVKARSEIRASGQEGDGMALAGIITGIVSVVLSVVIIAFLVVVISSGNADFDGTMPTGV